MPPARRVAPAGEDRSAPLAGPRGIEGERVADPPGQPLVVAGRIDETVAAGRDEIVAGAHPRRGDHRQPAGDRLLYRHSPAPLVAAVDEQTGGRVEGGELGVGDVAG